MTACINPEIWRKRRAGITPFDYYLKQNNFNNSTFLVNKPDVELVNALIWNNEHGGPKLFQRMKNMKMYCGVVLSQFSQMNDINNQMKFIITVKICTPNHSKPPNPKRSKQKFPQQYLKNIVASDGKLKHQVCSDYFNYQLTVIIRRVEITLLYTGPTISHAKITRLRVAGAKYAEVSAFT
ncbi:MAG: hypothetical protein EZS28_045919 [Streblomastix strix]|uniref:Uncharacterized protein n=1 Tax=Streblomastix strix TaxID=222440 RepID=A0A5J4TJK2_9EUKA|nr:MAG: hypothetical protein EZS28_045919 [Streblomastix strix]